jgi:general secretion pathway protein L
LLPKLLIFAPPPYATAALYRYAEVAADQSIGRWQTSAPSQLPKGQAAWLVLPASSVLMVRMRLPRLSPTKLAEVLPFAVEDRVAGDPASLHAAAASQVVEGLRLAAVVDRAWLLAAAKPLIAAGVNLRAAISETQLLPAAGINEWRVLFTAHDPASPVLVTPHAESITLDQPTAAPPASLQLALAKAKTVRKIVLLADLAESPADLPALAQSWAAALDLSVHAQAVPLLGGRIQLNEMPINLLAGLDTSLAAGTSALALFKPAAWVASTALAAHAVLIVADNARLAQQESKLRGRITQAFAGAFPTATIVDPALQMRRNVAQLRAAAGEASESDFLPALSRLANAGAQVQRLSYRDGKLEAVPVASVQASGSRRTTGNAP